MMLFKQILIENDYEKTLKLRRWVAFLLLGVGLVGIVCYFFLLDGSGLPDFAQGFYLGAASGFCLGSIILLVRSQYLLTHPEALKTAKVKETDERQRTIVQNAFRYAGIVTFFVSAAALFVVLPLSRPAFFALLGAMILYAVSFFLANIVLERKM